ncbi:uncharacterized protein LOC105164347 isoform X3 [Sesamum indicum]|uniref:Uncharacterized protein LOC105164347 isoform X3 n=1 Tax=Sesamum indicum TaxID=4182 RepID=A0A8M8V3X9_SESIN|nr:uncharacterized protein LOC105164347 isoform X3 [Sesamum indicum]
METRAGSGVIYAKDMKEKRGISLENPFTLKVGQVFTGFGVGCGIGIGVGRPLNLGAIPVLNQVMIATRGATDAFSGVQRHVNSSLRKVGAKNIEAGIGCGVGFGHGFGVGLAVKPSVLHQIQSHFWQVAGSVMIKLGIGSNASFPLNEGVFKGSLETGMSKVKEPSHENRAGSIHNLVQSVSNSTYEGNIRDAKTRVSLEETLVPKFAAVDTEHRSRTETVINNFLKNPLLEKGSSLHDQFSLQAGPLQLENDVLQMVLKHQVLIEELMKENEKLRHILVEELKVQPSKLQFSFTSRIGCRI